MLSSRHHRHLVLFSLSLFAVTAAPAPAPAAQEGAGAPAGSYFFVPDGDPATDRLPLKSSSAEVRIAGAIAHVKVRQLFGNDARHPIEAVYVFPASTRASVHGMRMRVGQRVIEAHIQRKDEARSTYQKAKSEGKRASLLEQHRENVFTTRVANILPGDRIEVELDYSELLVPEHGVYQLVYPAVVGPRYAGRAPDQVTRDGTRDGWMAAAFLPPGAPEPYAFDVRVRLEAGIPLAEVTSPSHPVTVDRLGPAAAEVKLAQPGGGDRDYVLRWRLDGDRIQTGVLVSPPDDGGEGYFALMVEPPRRTVAADMPPREFVFLVDVSGSMNGFPLDTAKVLLRALFAGLRPVDAFNVVMFAGGSRVLAPEGSVGATAENLTTALSIVDGENGGGGTELMGGLQASYAIPHPRDGRSRTVVVITDGFVGVEPQSFRFVREHLDEANLFAFGIGSSVNRALIEGLARAAFAEPFVVLDANEAAASATRFQQYIERPLLTDIKVTATGFDAFDVVPARIPDLLAERPLVVFGKYRGRAAGRLEITGRDGHGPFHREVALSAARPELAPLRWLWARKQVQWLEDDLSLGNHQSAEPLAQLGLRYAIVTSGTSFVAVDHVVANPGGQQETANQPLPLPQGVGPLAVGSSSVALSRSVMPPGDPLLTVTAPADARLVTAYFPFGLVKDLRYEPLAGNWQTRFLVPRTVSDGDYQVPVTILHADGHLETVTARYRIDSRAPDFDLVVTPGRGGVSLRVEGAEALRRVTVALVDDARVRLELTARPGEHSFVGWLPLAAGSHRLRVVVADEARNEAEQVTSCQVGK
jgi:Ca-activated chloride channel family protein